MQARRIAALAIAPAALVLTGQTAGIPEIRPGIPAGYLPREALPDSLALLPPPPAQGSARMARDEEAREAALKLKGSARWDRAAADARLEFPGPAEAFSCAAGIAIGPQATPRTYLLMQRVLIDAGLATYKAKTHYQRIRPFAAHQEASCTPADEAMLRGDGSYPSGHSAAGWAWALTLTGLVPERANEILQRGREFAHSRVICNVHWQSDVEAGQVIAAATIARLQADPKFREDVEAARTELQAAATAQPSDPATCQREVSTLFGRAGADRGAAPGLSPMKLVHAPT